MSMPEIEVDGYGTFEAPEGTRLVRALEANGVDILHRCGGYARCTTCRVVFLRGEPERMTVAEYNKLELNDLLGEVRLSCQILTDHAMAVRPLMTVRSSNLTDPGPEPKEDITPPPQWTTRAEQEAMG
jgi:ferredoxin